MDTKNKKWRITKHATCALAGALVAGVGLATPASAQEWNIGGFNMNLKSTISAGLGIRAVNPDGDLISTKNGGRDAAVASENFDDGNLNFRRGDVFTSSVRMLHELDIKNGNYGAFVSLSYFYDFTNNDADSTRRTDLSSSTRSQAGRGLDLYDAYIYGNFDVAGMPLTVRLGNQVINWGEALFRAGGVAQTNAFDVSRLVTPGTNIREGYLPSPMIYANISPFDNFSLEAYYQFQWRKTELVPVGTFHSTEDILGRGAQGFFFAGDPGGIGYAAAMAGGLPKLADDDAKDSGQFGVAARYFIDDLATEASLYYLNYHSKTPYLSATGVCGFAFGPVCLLGVPSGYYSYYAEDIDLYGASVSFPLGPVAFGAEVAYQPNYPLMLDDALTAASNLAMATNAPSRVNGVAYSNRLNYIANVAISVAPSLPYIGQVPGWIGANTIDIYSEAGLVHFDEVPVGVTGDLSAWGFSTSVSATYTNVIMSGLKLTPSVSVNYDVSGVSLDRSMGGPVEGKRSVSVGVAADLRSTYAASISYTNNIGGGLTARNADRDFVTLTASYSF